MHLVESRWPSLLRMEQDALCERHAHRADGEKAARSTSRSQLIPSLVALMRCRSGTERRDSTVRRNCSHANVTRQPRNRSSSENRPVGVTNRRRSHGGLSDRYRRRAQCNAHTRDRNRPTVTVALADLPAAVAVIVEVPGATARSRPAVVILATVESDDAQLTETPAAHRRRPRARWRSPESSDPR